MVSRDVGRLAIGQKALYGKVLSKTDEGQHIDPRLISTLPPGVMKIRIHEPQDKIVTSSMTPSRLTEYDVYYHGSLVKFEHGEM